MKRLRLGLIGAGQVYARLYRPALERSRGFEVVGVADPVARAAGVEQFETVESMLDGAKPDCVAVLSPPSFHAEHVGLCLERELPVLVEKPPALSVEEVVAWRDQGGAELVTPAFSRRYWPRYREGSRGGRAFALRLHTNPATWGATTEEPVARDLLPHAIDLARWLAGAEIGSTTVAIRDAGRLTGKFAMTNGVTFAWDVGHTAEYLETLSVDGKLSEAGEGFVGKVRRRLGRGVTPDVEGVSLLLADWYGAITGSRPGRLPGLADAEANVEAVARILGAELGGA